MVRRTTTVGGRLREAAGEEFEARISSVAQLLNSWLGYYGASEDPKQIEEVLAQTEHALRLSEWQRWVSAATRLRQLAARRVPGELASKAANSKDGAPAIRDALLEAFPSAFFRGHGLGIAAKGQSLSVPTCGLRGAPRKRDPGRCQAVSRLASGRLVRLELAAAGDPMARYEPAVGEAEAGSASSDREREPRIVRTPCRVPLVIILFTMPIVTVQTPGSRVTLTSERVRIEGPEDSEKSQRTEIPLAEIERLVLGEETQITSPALRELLRRGVPVSLFDGRNQLLGSFEPSGPPHAAARLRQYRAVTDSGFALVIARQLVEAKIANGRRLLQRLEANHPRLDAKALEHLGALQGEATRTPNLEELRGVEGTSAAFFYQLWARFLPETFPFERRTRRPPHNPVNACLSYIATLLYGELQSASYAAGLDPGLGCLHATEDGRWALPLDLMEPFRPVLVESLTLRLFAWRVLQADHFEERDGGVFLNTPGRRALWEHYAQRLDREFFSEHAGCRTTLRTRIAQAPVHFKTCLQQPELFSPFRLN